MAHYFFLILLAISNLADAQVDLDNSYQWNRQNIVAANGQVDQNDWYEWWYYKVVVPETGEAFFFVYGVINPWDARYSLAGTRSFISAGDYQDRQFTENKFGLSEFQASYDHVAVKIGDNLASDQRIQGKIQKSDQQTISWDLSIERDWQFNAMGWGLHARDYSGIYWYPAQASARMSGWINVGGKIYNLKNATAYQDRNWGRSFPKWWTWLVSNNFKGNPGTSFAAGGGRPKVLNEAYVFNGLCIGLKHQGKEYIFRTTDGDRIQMNVHWGQWQVTGKNKHGDKIEISAFAPEDKFLLLPFQTPREQIFYDYETLQGNMTIKLSKFSPTRLKYLPVVELQTDQAGIEWGSPAKTGLTDLFSGNIRLQ